MCKLLLFCFAFMSMLAQTIAPPVLNNQRISELVTTGVSTTEVIRIISTASRIDFDLRPVSTDALMRAGVPEEVVKAMAARENGQPTVISAMHVTDADVHVHDPSTGSRTLLKNVVDVTTRAGTTAKPRVFVQGSNDAWSIDYGKNGGKGGSHPQTVEVMKTFGQSCPN